MIPYLHVPRKAIKQWTMMNVVADTMIVVVMMVENVVDEAEVVAV